MFPAVEVAGEAVPTGSGMAADLQRDGVAVYPVYLVHNKFGLSRAHLQELEQ